MDDDLCRDVSPVVGAGDWGLWHVRQAVWAGGIISREQQELGAYFFGRAWQVESGVVKRREVVETANMVVANRFVGIRVLGCCVRGINTGYKLNNSRKSN